MLVAPESEPTAPDGSTVLILGSYNGIDSLGDRCLLKSVLAQGARSAPPGTHFVIHTGASTRWFDDFKAMEPALTAGVTCRPGLASGFGLLFVRARHLRLPLPIRALLAALVLPLAWLVSRRERRTVRRAVRDVRDASAVYYYGGSAWSEQFFWTEALPRTWFLLLCRLLGTPVYFGPQQYTPQRPWQRLYFRRVLLPLLTACRARSLGCIGELGWPQDVLSWDEVFGATGLYPQRTPRPAPEGYLLVNVRATNFLRTTSPGERTAVARLLAEIHRREGVSLVLFQMSGASFSDDTVLRSDLIEAGVGEEHVKTPPPLRSEFELLDLAEMARGTLSMSYHGCIFSLVAGCPAVPVVSGRYYARKFSDFARYAGGQHAPLLEMEGLRISEDADRVLSYFDAFDRDAVAHTRRRAGTELDAWYSFALGGAGRHHA